MGLLGGLFKIGEYAMKREVTKFVKATTKNAVTHDGWTFADKIGELATKDRGVDVQYVQSLIKSSGSTKSLKVITEYLKSNRNDIPVFTTKKLLNQCTEKAKHLEHAKQLKKMIQDQPDPLAYLSDHAHHIHDVLHHVTEWMV